MPKLRAHSPSILTEHLVQSLELCSLRLTSVEQLLSTPLPKISQELQKFWSNSNGNNQKEQTVDGGGGDDLLVQLSTIRKKILEFYACAMTTSEQLLKMDQDLGLFHMSCGSLMLDQLITTGSASVTDGDMSASVGGGGGGIAPKQITEVFGTQSTGKTMFCLSTALSLIQHRNSQHTVLYIDSQNAFCERKLATMFEKRRQRHLQQQQQLQSSSLSSSQTGVNEFCTMMEMMSRIHCAKSFDIFQLNDILQMVVREIKSENNLFYSCLRLIIVDCIGQVLLPSIQTPVGDALMMDIVQQMRILANEYNITFLVTNLATQSRMDQSSNADAGTTSTSLLHPLKLYKPTLGELWRSVPNTRLFLLKTEQSSAVTGRFHHNNQRFATAASNQSSETTIDSSLVITRRAFLAKSTSAPLLGEPVEFGIDATGIVDEIA